MENTSFNKNGFWIIPFILGFSKLTISTGSSTLLIMYKLDITPYLSIGINNPKPIFKSKVDHNCCGCDCDCNMFEEDDWKIMPQETYDKLQDFVVNADPDKIFGAFSSFEGDDPVCVVMVSDDSVEIPDDFDGFKTIKKVTTHIVAQENNEPK